MIEPESYIKGLSLSVKDYNAFNSGSRIYKLDLTKIDR